MRLVQQPVRPLVIRLAANYQRRLLVAYEEWARIVSREIQRAESSGQSITAVVDRYLPDLAIALKQLGRVAIRQAVLAGIRETSIDAEVQGLINQRIRDNEKFLDENLLPDIREKIVAGATGLSDVVKYQLDILALDGLFAVFRSRVAGYSGAVWSAVYDGARLHGTRGDREARREGQAPKRVRWVLDPTAKHCEESEHGYGCPDLAGEYDSWEELPTVPAARTTCLGNCKCRLQIQNETGRWEEV